MKLLRNYLFQALMFVVAVLAMQSCSCNKSSVEDKLNKIASDKAALIVVGDVEHVLNALEVEVKDGKLVLPEYLSDLFAAAGESRNFEDMNDDLDEFDGGIDFTNAVLVMNNISTRPSFVLNFDVNDDEQLYKFMSDMDEDVSKDDFDGYTVIGDEHASILIKDNSAYFVMKNGRVLAEDKAIEELEDWFDKAAEKPLADWKKQYLTAENTDAAAILNCAKLADLLNYMSRSEREQLQLFEKQAGCKIRDMNIAAKFSLNGPSVNINLSIMNSDGQVLDNPLGKEVNTDLLAYTRPNDFAVATFSISDKGLDAISTVVNSLFDKDMNRYKEWSNEYYNKYMNYYGDSYYYGQAVYYSNKYDQASTEKEMFNSFKNAVDGDFMIAAGLGSDCHSLEQLVRSNSEAGVHVVAAASCKNGNQRVIYDAMYNLCHSTDSVMSGSAPADNFSVKIDRDLTIYCALDGTNIVMSNEPITKGSSNNFNTADFAGKSLALQLSIPANHELISEYNLPCGLLVNASAEKMSYDLNVTLTDTKQNIVPAACKIMAALIRGYGGF